MRSSQVGRPLQQVARSRGRDKTNELLPRANQSFPSSSSSSTGCPRSVPALAVDAPTGRPRRRAKVISRAGPRESAARGPLVDCRSGSRAQQQLVAATCCSRRRPTDPPPRDRCAVRAPNRWLWPLARISIASGHLEASAGQQVSARCQVAASLSTGTVFDKAPEIEQAA